VLGLPVANYSKFIGFTYSLLDPTITCAASGRDLLFFQNFLLHHTLTIADEGDVVFLFAFAHGFIVGTSSNRISFIQHVPGFRELAKSFQQRTTLSYGIEHPLVWAACSPSGHQMICNVDNRQLLILNTREFESNTENSIVNPNITSHKGSVASISSCAYKPMFVSCGAEDRTVIVWDYSKQSSMLHCEFAEDLTDVSFHPSGDLLAVASSEKLYLLAATADSLVHRAQWPLFNCLSIEFSNGGHFLVAASHIITFINPYTQEIIATLRGHSGLIHSVAWSPDDNRLVSSGSDGNVIEWNAVNQQQSWNVTIPKCDFTCSVITGRGTVIACSQSESVYHLFAGRHHSRVSEERIGFSSIPPT
jgi:WD40 repeat protein